MSETRHPVNDVVVLLSAAHNELCRATFAALKGLGKGITDAQVNTLEALSVIVRSYVYAIAAEASLNVQALKELTQPANSKHLQRVLEWHLLSEQDKPNPHELVLYWHPDNTRVYMGRMLEDGRWTDQSAGAVVFLSYVPTHWAYPLHP
jgi:hypothetical protein